MRYEVTIDGATRQVEVEPAGEGLFRVVVDGVPREVDLLRPSPEAYQMLIDGQSWEAGCVPSEGGYFVDIRGVSTQVDVVDPRRRPLRLAGVAGGGVVSTPMPGRIVKLLANVGDGVRKGQPVLVIEAMKMENELKSPIDGVVKEVLVAEGQVVDAGTKLVRIEA
jgi:biotin carboxyl carrier protein